MIVGRLAVLAGGLAAALLASGWSHGVALSAGVDGGTITGRVKFVGQAPVNAVIDMGEEPDCKAEYHTPPRTDVVSVNPNGTLANVLVYVKAGLPAEATYPTPTTPVVLDQMGCTYHPHVLAVMVNQPLEIRNSDPLLHNIKSLGKLNRPFNISQPGAGMKLTRAFSAPEVVIPLECNVHGWMHAFLGVFAHPFFAVTGADGTFSLTGLPPGTYTIATWQEKYGAQEATVTIGAGETKTVEVAYTGG